MVCSVPSLLLKHFNQGGLKCSFGMYHSDLSSFSCSQLPISFQLMEWDKMEGSQIYKPFRMQKNLNVDLFCRISGITFSDTSICVHW